ncbi:MAG TPA: hypothetical protein VFV67_17360 [Actinophytocola sp.]|uniref:hypothetical protein n=1 Tax=Actinophytocola sp. TaxID=1872138 RepID=UPI002DB8B084|nr:hypothetical protein [Actinophytocola sp.]HEU5472424.1 hypothetical protein [Actinophytocola sp.]
MTVRERVAWIVTAAVVLVSTVTMVIVLNWKDGRPEVRCADAVIAYFHDDAAMRVAAERLDGDPRIAMLWTETQQQAYERFKEVFESQPNLAGLAGPDSLPATVRAVPAPGLTGEGLAGLLKGELATAAEVRPPQCTVDSPTV